MPMQAPCVAIQSAARQLGRLERVYAEKFMSESDYKIAWESIVTDLCKSLTPFVATLAAKEEKKR